MLTADHSISGTAEFLRTQEGLIQSIVLKSATQPVQTSMAPPHLNNQRNSDNKYVTKMRPPNRQINNVQSYKWTSKNTVFMN